MQIVVLAPPNIAYFQDLKNQILTTNLWVETVSIAQLT